MRDDLYHGQPRFHLPNSAECERMPNDHVRHAGNADRVESGESEAVEHRRADRVVVGEQSRGPLGKFG